MPIELPNGPQKFQFEYRPDAMRDEEKTFGTDEPVEKPKETSIILNHDTGNYSIVKKFHKFTTMEGTITGYLSTGNPRNAKAR